MITVSSLNSAKFYSSGRLTIEQTLHSEQFESIGIIAAKEINTKHFQLKLSGKSRINRLIAEEAHIEKDRKSIALKKKLICHLIKGKQLHLASTDTKFV